MAPKKRRAPGTTQKNKARRGELLLEEANLARCKGDIDVAEEKLRSAAAPLSLAARSDAPLRVSPHSRAAAYELALMLSQRGQHVEADTWLQLLGFRFKLSPQLLESQGAERISTTSTGSSGVCAVLDGALPDVLLTALRKAFCSESRFWAEHEYPTPGFFSYNTPLGSAEGKHSAYPLIHAAATHLKPLVERFFPPAADGSKTITSVEWWAHRRDKEGGGHQLHYDLDEAGLSILPPDAPAGHPLVSSVLYLSAPSVKESSAAGEKMASTMVTDQTLEKASVAKRAWLCPPAVNRLLVFDGGLLHGVVPRLQQPDEERITLMLGFWGQDPGPTCSPAPTGASSLGPNMKGPEPGLRWPELFAESPAVSDTATMPEEAALLQGPISPVWVPVPSDGASPGSSQDDGDGGVHFVGGWFLEHEPHELQERALAAARACAQPGAASCLDEVEEVSMEELARLRSAAGTDGVVKAASVAPPAELEEVEEMSIEELTRLRGMSGGGPVREAELSGKKRVPVKKKGRVAKKR